MAETIDPGEAKKQVAGYAPSRGAAVVGIADVKVLGRFGQG